MDRDAILLKCCETYTHLAMVISHADGVLQPQEGRAVAKGLNEFLDRVNPGPSVRAAVPGLLRDTARAVAAGQKDRSLAASTDSVLGFGAQLPIELRRDLLDSLRSIAASDGSVSPEEEQVLARIERAWNEDAASAPSPAPAKSERKAPDEGRESAKKRASASLVDAFKKGARPAGGGSERAAPGADAYSGDCRICGGDIEAGEECAWCAPSGDSIDLGRQWSIRFPAMWNEDSARCESMNEAGLSHSRYFESGNSRFGLYVVLEGKILSGGGVENADELARSMLQSFGMELIHVSDVTISGRPARVLDGRDAGRGHMNSTVLFQDGEEVTRFSFHDYVSRDPDQSMRTRERILSALVKGAAGAGGGAGSKAASAGKGGSSGKAGLAFPGSVKKTGNGATGRPSGKIAPVPPDDGVSEEEVQKLVVALIASKLGEAPGIGPSIVSTVFEAGESYLGLHQLLNSGVPALKKLRGIGQKKAEAIAEAYQELGSREVMEFAVRKAIVHKRKKEKLQKTIKAVLIWTAIFFGLLVMCTGPRR